jgi:putative membrane protein
MTKPGQAFTLFSPAALLWSAIFLLILIWSGIQPKDQLTWLLEVFPAMIGGLILLMTRKSFPLTPLLYILILLHCIILMVGGHYTYAEVPLFDEIKDMFGSTRNNYDKVGHFFQGFVPALIARELLIRKHVVKGNGWRNLFIISVSLAFSAFYELIEWWVALLSDEAAESFLGTQGYIWDTQSDMFYALIGAISTLLFLSKWHDQQLAIIKTHKTLRQ